MTRAGGRHPCARCVVVRLTDAALADLRTMQRKSDPQVVRWALKKCLLLERDPEAGEELRGGLIGFRKIAVGNRDWRLVWRVTHQDTGTVIVDVAEVWAFGARSDDEVYAEVQERVSLLREQPHTVPLADALAALGTVAYGLQASEEPTGDDLPHWLVHVLVNVVRMPVAEVRRLTTEQAEEIWQAYVGSPPA